MGLNKEIAEIVGYFIGDGYLTKCKTVYCVGFAGDKELDRFNLYVNISNREGIGIILRYMVINN